MHGVKREKRTASSLEARESRKKKEQAKVQSYLEVEAEFFRRKEEKDTSEEALAQTARLLTLNPELYTAWNYRREVLLALFESPLPSNDRGEGEGAKPDVFASLRQDPSAQVGPEQPQQQPSPPSTAELKQRRARLLLESDLELTEHALRAHPKVYWIWNHRLWCLQNLPEDPTLLARGISKWKVEMKLVEKMLELDPRNFHGWSYRRYLLSQLAATAFDPPTTDPTLFNDPVSSSSPSNPSTTLPSFPASLSSSSSLPPSLQKAQLRLAESELQYTLQKIESNFSNFSAWHQRLNLLPRVWDAKGFDEGDRVRARDEEYELVKQAMYTDPSDQSVWIYHRWLVEQAPTAAILTREIETIEELLELEPDSKWCMLSLAHYKTLLLSTVIEGQEAALAAKLKDEVRHLLGRLIDVDPDRTNRYRDLLAGKARF